MHQFIHGTDPQFAHLEQEARQSTRVFFDQPMPQGATPSKARVGFCIDESGTTTLYVDRGVAYEPGEEAHPEVQAWFEQGERRFDSFAACVAWIRSRLAPCYSARAPGLEDLTDLEAVNAQIQKQDQPVRVDRETLYAFLRQEVRGQDHALRTLANRVAQHCARVAPRRPLTLFAVGHTGVGKTRTAEVLPEALEAQNAPYAYIRLDMSEYQEPHRVSQLLGAPAGYVGYGEGSELLDGLQRNLRTIVHFDEIEKAHPNILKALMNGMDAGRLSRSGTATGAEGRTVDCRQAIFFFTSNLDCEGILGDLEMRADSHVSHVVDEVCRRRLRSAGIKPELVGRINSFLAYGSLSPSVRAEITTLTVVRVAKEYGVNVRRIAPSVVVYLLDQSDDAFGVRPIEYLVDSLLGQAIEKTAVRYGQTAVEVLGPPFRCVPFQAEPRPKGPDVSGVDLSGLSPN